MKPWQSTSLLLACALAPAFQAAHAGAPHGDQATAPEPAVPQIFAPGVISGPANDGSPVFTPDGSAIFFTRTNGNWGAILESHNMNGQWSRPILAPFSGEWPDSSPAMAPDGSYLVFESRRPVAPLAAQPKQGEPIPGVVSNLWRVDRTASGWSKPVRLPDTVNISHGIWKPSVSASGTVYFVSIDDKGAKRLYSSQYQNGAYQQAQPLPFSAGTTLDVDPEIAPDESFLVFVSAGRLPGDTLDHLFIVARQGQGWGPVLPIRYAGDDKPAFSTDDEPHLGPDHRTLYFSSDRAFSAHYPRTPEQAQQDFNHMESWGWFGGYSNVLSIPVDSYLDAAKNAAKGTS